MARLAIIAALGGFLIGYETGRPGTFWVYAGLGICAFILFAARVPETKDRTLERIEDDVAGLRCAQAPTKIAGAQAAAPGKGAVP